MTSPQHPRAAQPRSVYAFSNGSIRLWTVGQRRIHKYHRQTTTCSHCDHRIGLRHQVRRDDAPALVCIQCGWEEAINGR
jgi:hypothetical protein